ncbi:protein HIRA-like isoform X1 [Haliotis cracherodii]|uniref:protein HIRA-like isoform X1 n=1 Tax=Haliotis cracherodii TaxID=6455 RepID=UPI0039EA8A2B
MRLLKPNWVSHEGKPIFSIDIHPDGSRFATGGQSDDAGNVVIWNMGPVQDEEVEKDENVPKVLCQMDDHLACVNCVRWSHSGKFLASGGDDKLIMIWQHSKFARPSSVFGSNVVNVESWRPASTLRGHLGDVLDLAWSPQDIWLASCSVDNTIIVWNVHKFPEQVATLKGHSGLVKGVTWDPVGKYLASQSDDKTLKVWRTLDWQQETCVAEPFKECGGTTHVLRLNWSPDGHYIVSAHAMNNSGPTAQIIERDGWKATLDFVGHRKAITVVRFNPQILTKKIKKDSGKSQQYSCCAIGSKDRSLSIWLTALRRPLVVTHDLFNSSIMDISWSQNGLELMCCSIDGSVAYVNFTQEEIGHALSKQEVQTLLEKIYGKSLPLQSNLAANAASQIIESAALFNLQLQQKEKEKFNDLENKSNSSMKVNGETPFKVSQKPNTDPRDKQIETKTADGRRRITPIFLAPQPEIGFEEAPLPFTSKKIEFASSERQSSIQIEKQDRVTGPGIQSSPSQSLQSPPPGSSLGSQDCKTPSTSDPHKATDAKTPASSASTAVFQPMKALEKTPTKSEKSKSVPAPSTTTTTPAEKSVEDKQKEYHRAKLASGLSLKRKIDDRRPGKVGRPRKADREAREAERAAMSISQSISTPLAPDREIVRHVPVPSDLHLPVPTIEKASNKQILGKAGDPGSVALEVENCVGGGSHKLHKVRCVKDGNVTWEQVMTSKVNAVTGSSHVYGVSCENHSVSFFSEGGRKTLPTIVLNSNVSILKCTNYHVMAITRKGSLYVWNLQSRCAVIKNECLASIMTGSDKVEKTALTTDGIPVISLSNKKSYTFAVDLGTWVLVNDREDTLHLCSNHHGCLPSGSVNMIAGPLTSLQANPDRPGHKAAGMLGSSSELKQTATLSHLESQVAVCLNLKSTSEYKFWLLTYVRYLVQEGFETQLREVCNDLLGPLYKSKKSSSWQEQVLGLNKRDVLREILPIIGSNLRWQRLYTEYHEQLESV